MSQIFEKRAIGEVLKKHREKIDLSEVWVVRRWRAFPYFWNWAAFPKSNFKATPFQEMSPPYNFVTKFTSGTILLYKLLHTVWMLLRLVNVWFCNFYDQIWIKNFQDLLRMIGGRGASSNWEWNFKWNSVSVKWNLASQF